MEGIITTDILPANSPAAGRTTDSSRSGGKSAFGDLLACLTGSAGQVAAPTQGEEPAGEQTQPHSSPRSDEAGPQLVALVQLLTLYQGTDPQASGAGPAGGLPPKLEETVTRIAPEIWTQLSQWLAGKTPVEGKAEAFSAELQQLLAYLPTPGDKPQLPKELSGKLAAIIARLASSGVTTEPATGAIAAADRGTTSLSADNGSRVPAAATIVDSSAGVKSASPHPSGSGIRVTATGNPPPEAFTTNLTAAQQVANPTFSTTAGITAGNETGVGVAPPVANRKQTATSQEINPGGPVVAGSGSDFASRLSLTAGGKDLIGGATTTPVEAFYGENGPHLIGQIVAQAKMVAGSDGQAIRIRLKPDYLGDLNLLVSTEHGVITAHFIAKSHLTAELIQAGLPELREALNQQGIPCQQLAVSVDNGQGNHQGGCFQSETGNYQQAQPPVPTLSGDFPEPEWLPSSVQSWHGTGLLNCIV